MLLLTLNVCYGSVLSTGSISIARFLQLSTFSFEDILGNVTLLLLSLAISKQTRGKDSKPDPIVTNGLGS